MRFKEGDYVVRSGHALKDVAPGTLCIIKSAPINDPKGNVHYKVRVVGQTMLRNMAEVNLRAATEREVAIVGGRRSEPHQVIDPAWSRDGLTPSQMLLARASLICAKEIAGQPKGSVRYQLRKNPPVRTPTVHPVPVGWEYKTIDVNQKDLQVMVLARPAGWSPFD